MLRRAAINDLHKIIYVLEDLRGCFEGESMDFPYEYDYESLQEEIINGHIYLRGVGTDIAGFVCIGNYDFLDSLDVKWSRNTPSTSFYKLIINKNYMDRNIEEELILLVEHVSIKHRLNYVKGITYEKFTSTVNSLDRLNYNLIGKVFIDGKKYPFYCYEKIL